MQRDYTMSEALQEELNHFFQTEDLLALKESLRRLFIEYLEYDLKTGLCDYVEELFYPFNNLLDVLHTAAQEKTEYFYRKQAKEAGAVLPLTTKEKVIAFLVASLSPSAIFLLHHHTDDDNKTAFDLLAVIPHTAQTSFAYYEQVISMANIEDAVINVSLHKEEMIQQQLKEGHIYYSIVCNKENMVYKNKSFELPEQNTAALKELAEKAITEFNTAHKKADSFLQGAANYRGEHEKEMAAFMLQQAVELTLRGLITALLGNCAKTHCLRELQKPLKRCAPEIRYLFSADAAEESRLITLLEKAYIESRYSSQLVISDKDIDILTEVAEELHEKVKVLFEEKMKRLLSGITSC